MEPAKDPYYWHYRCDVTGLLTRVERFRIPDEKVREIEEQQTPPPEFPCAHCNGTHRGFLQRSKFG